MFRLRRRHLHRQRDASDFSDALGSDGGGRAIWCRNRSDHAIVWRPLDGHGVVDGQRDDTTCAGPCVRTGLPRGVSTGGRRDGTPEPQRGVRGRVRAIDDSGVSAGDGDTGSGEASN